MREAFGGQSSANRTRDLSVVSAGPTAVSDHATHDAVGSRRGIGPDCSSVLLAWRTWLIWARRANLRLARRLGGHCGADGRAHLDQARV